MQTFRYHFFSFYSFLFAVGTVLVLPPSKSRMQGCYMSNVIVRFGPRPDRIEGKFVQRLMVDNVEPCSTVDQHELASGAPLDSSVGQVALADP
jgi:hypothetical protein